MSPWNATNKHIYIHDNIFGIWKIKQQFLNLFYIYFFTFYELDLEAFTFLV